ncbi:hypothetical protein LSCM1_06742 [Leishmania martiniquensis]|uniref:GPI mannosyltransferase 2 n=1 Tax=Leishmania martiniquensis TaxID=1580590 RepID=A0A836HBH6_9TRYP|nr:hypothetical protein LSCM1_06742 [Leishmania martiniquensis]
MRRFLAFALVPYTGLSFNFLDRLGTCTDTTIFFSIAFARLLLLCLMWLSRTVAPVLFRAPGGSFVFDTGEELYDDARLSMIRNWDGVHMFFIAHYGYLYENQIVFFPGLPAVIRGIEYVTQQLLPALHTIAPVSLYVCLLNVTASCLTGVLLRRLTILTFLGPEAVQCTCQWRSATAHLSTASEATMQSAAEATTCYRLMCRMTGTVLDAPDIHAPLPATVAEAKADVLRRRRIVGGAVLVWIITPAMVFTVAVYTESLYALTTISGVYLLASYDPLPRAVQQRIASYIISITTPGSATTASARALAKTRLKPPLPLARQWPWAASKTHNGAAASGHIPGIASLLHNVTPGAPEAITVKWAQSFLSLREVEAVLLLMLAGTFRSNAFTSAGFICFPLFVQMALPDLHEAQSSAVLAGASARVVMSAAAKHAGARSGRAPLVARCPTLRPPLRRSPHPLRTCIVAAECICVTLPYLFVNYMGYQRFVLQMGDTDTQVRLGGAFWKLYPMLQEKYWGVSPFSAYTFVNFPNVVLALPVAVLATRCTYFHYVAPGWANFKAATAATAGARPTRWQYACKAAMPLVRSSNVMHFIALLTLALTVMHVQVTNRFVLASPALFWLLGKQLATNPTSLSSQFILLWCILWGMAGGILFPNHLPWT